MWKKGNKKGLFCPCAVICGDYTTGCISRSKLPLQCGKHTSCLFNIGVVVLVARKTRTGIIEFLMCMMRIYALCCLQNRVKSGAILKSNSGSGSFSALSLKKVFAADTMPRIVLYCGVRSDSRSKVLIKSFFDNLLIK